MPILRDLFFLLTFSNLYDNLACMKGEVMNLTSKQIKAYLKKNEERPADLMRATGVSEATISRILAGKARCGAATARRLSPVLGVVWHKLVEE